MGSPVATNLFVGVGEPMIHPYKSFVAAGMLPVPTNPIFSYKN